MIDIRNLSKEEKISNIILDIRRKEVLFPPSWQRRMNLSDMYKILNEIGDKIYFIDYYNTIHSHIVGAKINDITYVINNLTDQYIAINILTVSEHGNYYLYFESFDDVDKIRNRKIEEIINECTKHTRKLL